MRLGIISDTHDRLDRTNRAVELLQAAGAEALIHCGDLMSPDIVFACGVLPSYFVFGNNDYELAELRLAMKPVDAVCLECAGEVVLAEKRIAVTHGHLHKDIRRLVEAKPDYRLYGHSHIASDRHEDGIRWINPGALQRAEKYSVALLDLKTDKLEFITVPR